MRTNSPPARAPTAGPNTTGSCRTAGSFLLWFEVDDFEAAVDRVEELALQAVKPRHRNPPDGDGGPNHWELGIRDPDGYTVVLASPDGTANGGWRPDREA